MNAPLSTEDKIIRLETQLAFQEDTIEQLNQTIYVLQQEILKQREQINLIGQKLGALPNFNLASEAEETPPPHY